MLEASINEKDCVLEKVLKVYSDGTIKEVTRGAVVELENKADLINDEMITLGMEFIAGISGKEMPNLMLGLLELSYKLCGLDKRDSEDEDDGEE